MIKTSTSDNIVIKQDNQKVLVLLAAVPLSLVEKYIKYTFSPVDYPNIEPLGHCHDILDSYIEYN
ncbi:MAG: hypothetical protein LN588_02205 [Rickettsia endosymbiont of Bryobia graminum]|nr:hypothetical protein [Rickettsia endosymbiont of Bryobia graminum]